MDGDELTTSNHATCDYGLIAWLAVIKQVRPVPEATRKIRRGKMEYVFMLPDSQWTALRVEYSNSVFPRFLEEIKLRKDPSF